MITQNSLVSQFALQNFKLYISFISRRESDLYNWWQLRGILSDPRRYASR